MNGEKCYSVGETEIAFSPDATQLAVADETGSLSLWDIDSRTPIYEVGIESNCLSGLVFSPDGKTLACSGGNSLTLLDPATGIRMITFSIPSADEIQTMIFSSSGEKLVVGDLGGNIIILDVDPRSWVSRACQLVGRNFTAEEWDEYIGGDYRSTCGDF